MIKTLAVIPARWASTRLPGKSLVKIAGRELVLRVLDGVRASDVVDRTIVATDDKRIASVVRAAGGDAMMTPPELPSGGDRVAWVARRVESEIVLNVQGDDPLVGPDMIAPLVAVLDDARINLAVLACRIENEAEVRRPDIVKVVFAQDGDALYFSRAQIPYPRVAGCAYYKHIGPYAWRRSALLEFAQKKPTHLETAESLEMLRVLEHGGRIRCVPAPRDTIEIDTPDDVKALEAYLSTKGE